MANWNILLTFVIFYDHLVHFVRIWYIFSSCPKKYLATLHTTWNKLHTLVHIYFVCSNELGVNFFVGNQHHFWPEVQPEQSGHSVCT
jgi:hypothetical protein